MSVADRLDCRSACPSLWRSAGLNALGFSLALCVILSLASGSRDSLIVSGPLVPRVASSRRSKGIQAGACCQLSRRPRRRRRLVRAGRQLGKRTPALGNSAIFGPQRQGDNLRPYVDSHGTLSDSNNARDGNSELSSGVTKAHPTLPPEYMDAKRLKKCMTRSRMEFVGRSLRRRSHREFRNCSGFMRLTIETRISQGETRSRYQGSEGLAYAGEASCQNEGSARKRDSTMSD